MNNYCIRFTCEDEATAELITAALSSFPFYAFVEEDNYLAAYIEEADWTPALQDAIQQIELPFLRSYTAVFLPYQNWNAVWESNFQPIVVNNFCGVRAGFHAALETVTHEILIDPEMAFGTGHHATTYMMIELMEEIDFNHQFVFDFGCGTGILAILAAKMGASNIDAIDLSPAAYENTLKNADVNNIHNINAVLGTLEILEPKQYDIILANINRNVLLDAMPTLFARVKSGGQVLLSGILLADLPLIKQAALDTGFQTGKHLQRDGWIALRLHKP